MDTKKTVVISAPVDTYSGYGARARDIVKALLASAKYDVKVLSQRWGDTRFGYLADHNETVIQECIIPSLTSRPDIWIQVTIPVEFEPVGTFNIGITAGIETTVAKPDWIEGLNRMDLNLVSSKHSKDIFQAMDYSEQDNKTKKVIRQIKLNKPVEILLEGADLNKYFEYTDKQHYTSQYREVVDTLNGITESFCYLFVGHWLQGDLGHDRKNIGYTVKTFLETFKNKPTPPALILKTSSATTSVLDREEMLRRIDSIKKEVNSSKLPNIYLLHGDMTDQEMNALYNHSKIKAMLCLSKGEGFGRPMLEFTLAGKPVIASGWSGHLDFLDPQLSLLVGGTLEQVHPSATNQWISEESQWYKADDAQATRAIKEVYKNYKTYKEQAKKLKYKNKNNFALSNMQTKLENYLSEYVPTTPKVVELNLPK